MCRNRFKFCTDDNSEVHIQKKEQWDVEIALHIVRLCQFYVLDDEKERLLMFIMNVHYCTLVTIYQRPIPNFNHTPCSSLRYVHRKQNITYFSFFKIYWIFKLKKWLQVYILNLESFIVLQEQLLIQIGPNYAFILSSSYLPSIELMLFKFTFNLVTYIQEWNYTYNMKLWKAEIT